MVPLSLALWSGLKLPGMSWIRDLLCSILEGTQHLFGEICESNRELGWNEVVLYLRAGHILSTEDVNCVNKLTYSESYTVIYVIKFKTLCPVV